MEKEKKTTPGRFGLPVPGKEGFTVNPSGQVFNNGVELPVKKSYGVLTVDIEGEDFKLHELVYSVFHGDIKKGCVVLHLDGNKENNKSENLKQFTLREASIFRAVRRRVSEQAEERNAIVGLPPNIKV